MKSSSDNSAATSPPAKRPGPVRLGAIVPLLIVSALIALYFKLFFDIHLRHGLEYAATQANGAEVDIGRLDTSFWKASMVIGDIAMTDPAMPARNRLQIGSINFSMLWDGLLRGKVVINEASINDIQLDTPRSHPGQLVPVKPEEKGPGAGAAVLAKMQDEFSGNVLGDLAAVATGADPRTQLSSIGGDLKSSTKIAELQHTLDQKNQQWQDRLKQLPTGQDVSALQKRLAGIKPDLQDITQVQSSLKELESLRSDIDTKVKSVRETGALFGQDMDEFRRSYSELDGLVRDDVRDLQAKLHLPSLDAKTLSRSLFGMDVLGRIQQARGYMDEVRSYMPARGAKKTAPPVQQRSKGHDYAFGRPDSYPLFWLRKALISTRSQGGGDLSGEIRDVSSDPAMTGRPMVATIKGNFPQQDISGVSADLVIDHTGAVPVERLQLKVGSYGVAGRTLASSPNIELGIASARGSADVSAELSGDQVDVRMGSRFTGVAFTSRAQSNVVREMVAASIAGLDQVSLDAHVTGTWSSLDWQISTSLADALERGMRRYLQGKMDDARAQIEAMVQGRLADQRKQLNTRLVQVESGIKSMLAERQAQVDKLQADANAVRNRFEERRKSLLDAQQQKLKQGTDKLMDDLRRKF